MKKSLFLLIFSLFIIQVNVFGYAEAYISKLDSTYKITKIEAKDSLKIADSLQVFKKHKIVKIAKISVLSILAGISGYNSLLYGLEANGYTMLFLGLLCIGLVISIFKIKKRKPKTYQELKIKDSEPIIKKHPKFNKSWNYSLYFGVLGFSLTIISVLSGLSFGFLFLPLFLSSLLFFILGFKGQYNSPQQFRRKLFIGFLGLLLHWLPFIVLILFLLRAGE